jgi:hypothetical protein
MLQRGYITYMAATNKKKDTKTMWNVRLNNDCYWMFDYVRFCTSQIESVVRLLNYTHVLNIFYFKYVCLH